MQIEIGTAILVHILSTFKDSCGAHTLKKEGLPHGAKYVFVGLKEQGKETEPDWTREVVAEKKGESAMLGMTIGMCTNLFSA